MDLNELTVEDCVENYYRKGEIVILENGQVLGFRKEKEKKDAGVQNLPEQL